MPKWSIGLLHFKELFNSYFVYSITCNGESIETIKVENAGKLRNCGSLYVEVSKLRMHEVGKSFLQVECVSLGGDRRPLNREHRIICFWVALSTRTRTYIEVPCWSLGGISVIHIYRGHYREYSRIVGTGSPTKGLI